MPTFTNHTGAPLVFPTVQDPVTGELLLLQPGDTAELPDPAPPATVFDVEHHKIDDVLEWVGADTARAGVALAAEELAPKPRPTLIAQLAELISPPTPEG